MSRVYTKLLDQKGHPLVSPAHNFRARYSRFYHKSSFVSIIDDFAFSTADIYIGWNRSSVPLVANLYYLFDMHCVFIGAPIESTLLTAHTHQTITIMYRENL